MSEEREQSTEVVQSTAPVVDAAATVVPVDTSPPIPEGVVAAFSSQQPAAVTDEDLVFEETVSIGEADYGEEVVDVPDLGFLGAAGPEFDFIAPEEGPVSFTDVIFQLVDEALELDAQGAGDALTGERVAQIFCRGDVEDPRVELLLLLLAQNRLLTAPLVLSAVESLGHEHLVQQARLVREELTAAGEVAVEQLTATGYVPVETAAPYPAAESGIRYQVSGSQPGNGAEPGEAERRAQSAERQKPSAPEGAEAERRAQSAGLQKEGEVVAGFDLSPLTLHPASEASEASVSP